MSRDVLPSPRMLAKEIRPLVNSGDAACISGTPMVPIHRATLTTILLVLENAADALGEAK